MLPKPINFFRYKIIENKLAKKWGIYKSHWGEAENIAFSICVSPIFYTKMLRLISSNKYIQCDCSILTAVWTIYFRRTLKDLVQSRELDAKIIQYVISGIPAVIPVTENEINKIIKNRLSFFSKFFINDIDMTAFVEEAEYLFATDIIENKPVIFNENSPLPIIDFNKQMQLRYETSEYFKVIVTVMSTVVAAAGTIKR